MNARRSWTAGGVAGAVLVGAATSTPACDQGRFSLGVGPAVDASTATTGGTAGSSGAVATGGAGRGGSSAGGGGSGGTAGATTGGDSGLDDAGADGDAPDAAAPGRSGSGALTRIDVADDGTTFSTSAFDPAVSDDGQRVVFVSNGLSLEDTSGHQDIYVRDRAQNLTVRVNLNAAGEQANDASFYPALSPDGSRVAFVSLANNLVPGLTELMSHLFVTGPLDQLDDFAPGVTDVTPNANANSHGSTLSDRGELVVFQSSATNLVSEGTPGPEGIFLFRSSSGTTESLSRLDDGSAISLPFSVPQVSRTGSVVAFCGAGQLYVFEPALGSARLVSVGPDRSPGNGETRSATLSADGQRLVFVSAASNLVDGDDNGLEDVFVYDLATETTRRISVAGDGSQADGPSDQADISGDGQWVVFQSTAKNLVPDRSAGEYALFLHDLENGTTVEVELVPGGLSFTGVHAPSLSHDGSVLVFDAYVGSLIPDAPDYGVFAFAFD